MIPSDSSSRGSVTPLRFPRSVGSKGEGPRVAPSLPDGWSLNEKDEVVNEEGDVVFDICEEDATPPPPKDSIHAAAARKNPASRRTQPPQPSAGSVQKLRPELETIFQDIEAAEASDPALGAPIVPGDDFGAPNFALQGPPDDPAARKKAEINRAEGAKREAANWGRGSGLIGLKGAFGATSKGKRKDNPSPSPAPPATAKFPPLATCRAGEMSHQTSGAARPNLPPSSSQPPTKKPRKSVSFAGIPSPPPSPPRAASDATAIAGAKPKDRRTIVLSDVVERILPEHNLEQEPATRAGSTEWNARNAHLNPRLAALLPRSYQHSPPPSHCGDQSDDEVAEEDDGQDTMDASDCGSESGSLHSYGSDSEDMDDLDLQSALDMRQAALAYHALRPSLGAGAGTGPLGGFVPPPAEDGEDLGEWVPQDAKCGGIGSGVFQERSGRSRFRRLQRGVEAQFSQARAAARPEDLGGPVIAGKLFGQALLISGPEPTPSKSPGGGITYELPGRAGENYSDDDLTAEEQAILEARLNALELGEEEKEVAIQVGNNLMDLMGRVQRGVTTLDEDGEDEGDALAGRDVEMEEVDREGDKPPEIRKAETKGFHVGMVRERPRTAAEAATPPIQPSPAKDHAGSRDTRKAPCDYPRPTAMRDEALVNVMSTPDNALPAKKVSRFKAARMAQ